MKRLEAIIELILSICHTGEVGDGKIFIYPIEEAVRIRTNERGPISAVSLDVFNRSEPNLKS